MTGRVKPILFTLITAVVPACADSRVVTNTYASMAEAVAARALERGSLPLFVPPGAHDIRTAHDEGTSGRRWGLFSFKPEDSDQLRAALGPEIGLGGIGADAPPRIEWWPVLLRGTLDAQRVSATGLRGYGVTGDGLVAAVNWNQRRAYYWTPR